MQALRLVMFVIVVSAGAAVAQQFTAVPQSSGSGVWIVNTETGEAKYCAPKNRDGSYVLMCISVVE